MKATEEDASHRPGDGSAGVAVRSRAAGDGKSRAASAAQLLQEGPSGLHDTGLKFCSRVSSHRHQHLQGFRSSASYCSMRRASRDR